MTNYDIYLNKEDNTALVYDWTCNKWFEQTANGEKEVTELYAIVRRKNGIYEEI